MNNNDDGNFFQISDVPKQDSTNNDLNDAMNNTIHQDDSFNLNNGNNNSDIEIPNMFNTINTGNSKNSDIDTDEIVKINFNENTTSSTNYIDKNHDNANNNLVDINYNMDNIIHNDDINNSMINSIQNNVNHTDNNQVPASGIKEWIFKHKSIVLGILAFIVFFVLFFFLFGGFSGLRGITSNGATVKQGQKIKIKSSITNMNISITDVERGVKVSPTEAFQKYKEPALFTKIMLEVTNTGTTPTSIGTFVTIDLLDAFDNKLANCTTSTLLFDYDITDTISDVDSNQTVTGALYCQTDSKNGKKVRISAVTEVDKDALKQGNIKSTSMGTYYVVLN